MQYVRKGSAAGGQGCAYFFRWITLSLLQCVTQCVLWIQQHGAETMNAHTKIAREETLTVAPGLIRFTPSFPEAVANMDDRTKLMLIDWIADQLSNDMGEELAEGLAVAFERAEEGFSGVFTPLYPAGAVQPATWREWRLERDRVLRRERVL
jgi:hypothetical protein